MSSSDPLGDEILALYRYFFWKDILGESVARRALLEALPFIKDVAEEERRLQEAVERGEESAER